MSATENVRSEVDLDEAFRDLVLDASLSDANSVNPIVDLLRAHLDIDPVEISQASDVCDSILKFPVLQAGLNAFLAKPGRTYELIGVQVPVSDPRLIVKLPMLFTPASLSWPGPSFGPPTWEQLESGFEKTTRCLAQGLLLVRDEQGPFCIWITNSRPAVNAIYRHVIVGASDPDRAVGIIHELRALQEEHSTFRGEMFAPGYPVQFMAKPAWVGRDEVILPEGLLDRIDQHAIGVSKAQDVLTSAGQHLKRGLLLFGPPGTGKTHTIRYLASQLPEETSIIVLPHGSSSLYWLRFFLPLMGPKKLVVLDDVDDIAGDRSLPGARDGLFHLLDVLDGLHSHGDTLFVLTTNRLDVLEPAVAARPGRIDEALEVPRPDADCRRRLFDLYRRDMHLTISDDEIDQLIERTEGVTAAFFKELLRRATVVGVERGTGPDADGNWQVTGVDVFGALDEMLDPDNPATRLLLGGEAVHAHARVQFAPAKSLFGDKKESS